MGTVQTFKAINIKYSEETKTVCMVDPYMGPWEFDYTFMCVPGVSFAKMFFNMDSRKVLVMVDHIGASVSSCYILTFWMADDLPILSSKILLNQDSFIDSMKEDFKDKCASYLLDKIINS